MESVQKKTLPAFVDASLVEDMCKVRKRYRTKKKQKKSGGTRIIHAPNKSLKKLQKRLLGFLYEWSLPFNFFGFVREKSIIDNALSHSAGIWGVPEWLINIDLKDAFPSITGKVLLKTLRRMFEQLELPKKKSIQEIGGISLSRFQNILLGCVLHRGRLPQGAPTSPYLLNLTVFREGILFAIEEVFANAGVKMSNISIYADDISITMFDPPSRELIGNIISAIEAGGCFRVNRKKVRTNSYRYALHEITGLRLVIDSEGFVRATVPQKKRNELRGMIHRAARILTEGREPTEEKDGFTVNVIAGHIAWLNMVYPGKMPSGLRNVIEPFKEALKNL